MLPSSLNLSQRLLGERLELAIGQDFYSELLVHVGAGLAARLSRPAPERETEKKTRTLKARNPCKHQGEVHIGLGVMWTAYRLGFAEWVVSNCLSLNNKENIGFIYISLSL